MIANTGRGKNGHDEDQEEKKIEPLSIISASENEEVAQLVDEHRSRSSFRTLTATTPSQTKSWKDQAAPEPFSLTPKLHLHHRKTAGYNSDFHHSAEGGATASFTDPKRNHLQIDQHNFPLLSPQTENQRLSLNSKWTRSLTQTKEGKSNNTLDPFFSCVPPPPLSNSITNDSQKDLSTCIEIHGACRVNKNNSDDSIHHSPQHSISTIPNRRPQSYHPSSSTHKDTHTNIEAQIRHFQPELPVDHLNLCIQIEQFITLSVSSLQNDIGTLFVRASRIDEARRRYQLSIESATITLETFKSRFDHQIARTKNINTEARKLLWLHQQLLNGVSPRETSLSNHNNPSQLTDLLPQPSQYPLQSFKVNKIDSSLRRLNSASTIAEISVKDKPHVSLIPLLQSLSHEEKQQREISSKFSPSTSNFASDHAISPYDKHCEQSNPFNNERSFSQSNTLMRRTLSCNSDGVSSLEAIVHDIHQHQKLDFSEDIHSCNGCTPLGLEYICDPLPLLSGAWREWIGECIEKLNRGDFQGLEIARDDSGSLEGRRFIIECLMEATAGIAARLNLASLEYRKAGGGVSENLHQVLNILCAARQEMNAVKMMLRDNEKEQLCWKSYEAYILGLLQVVAHINIGTVLYRLSKVRDSMSSFEAAKGVLEMLDDNNDGFDSTMSECDIDKTQNLQGEEHQSNDNRFPSKHYLLLVTRVNMSRVFVRLKDIDSAENLCRLITMESKQYFSKSRFSQTHVFRRSYSHSGRASVLNTASTAYHHDLDRRYQWLHSVAEHFLTGLVHEARGEIDDYKAAVVHYNRLLSLAREKLDRRHVFICTLLERRGAVLFQQRKLQCSMLSYLACLKILEYQNVHRCNVFNREDYARVLYGVARVLHDKEEYHDALHMYQRALACQRDLVKDSRKPSLDVITTLCNISRVHHLSGDIDAALSANKEVLELATILLGERTDHPFLIHRLKVEGNILVEARNLDDAMKTFIDAGRRCCGAGRNQMIATMRGTGGSVNRSGSQEDADAGDSSILSIRSAASLAHISFLYPAAGAA